MHSAWQVRVLQRTVRQSRVARIAQGPEGGRMISSYQPTTDMTQLQIKGNWNQIKGKLKQKYGVLTDNDLVFEEGKEDELLGRLQERTGEAKEKLRAFIEDL